MKDKASKLTERKNKNVPAAPPLIDDDHEELLALLRAQTEDGRRIRKHLHEQVAGGVYRSLMSSPSQSLPDTERTLVRATAAEYAADVVKRMNPRDPLEEMLTMQALWAHGRAAQLSKLANMQDGIDAITRINDAADKASNTFRRLMLALAEYRRPPRTGDSFTAIKQANIAGQQVVQNLGSPKLTSENATNEQGCSRDATDRPEALQTLPPHARRAEITARGGPAHETMAAKHRPPDAGGQGSLEDERHETR